MPFPIDAQRRGGHAPSSAQQKLIASQTIQQVKPWLSASGPLPLGKLVSRYNAVKPGVYKRFVKSWQEDFEQGCQAAEAAIAEFERDQREYPEQYKQLQVLRYSGQNSSGDCWCLFVVRATLIGDTDTLNPRIARMKEIHRCYNGEGKTRWESLLPIDDPFLQRILTEAAKQYL